MSEINKCAYCGHAPLTPADRVSDQDTLYQVYCYWCGCKGPEHPLKTKAISLWNMMQVKEYSVD